MSLQVRQTPGGPLLSPLRDWAYNYPQIIECIIRAFNQEYWPELHRLLTVLWQDAHPQLDDEEAYAAAWDELLRAKDAYVAFVQLCAGQEDPQETLQQVFDKSGWTQIHPAAQAVWLAMLGQVMTGQLFMGLRDITTLGAGPGPEAQAVLTANDLLKSGMEARRILNRISVGQELTQDLSTLVRLCRDQGISWEALERLLRREQQLEGTCSNDPAPTWWRRILGGLGLPT